jgi:hypothetical protein
MAKGIGKELRLSGGIDETRYGSGGAYWQSGGTETISVTFCDEATRAAKVVDVP